MSQTCLQIKAVVNAYMYEVGNGGASAAGIVMVLTFMVAGRYGDENTDGEGMAGLVQPV